MHSSWQCQLGVPSAGLQEILSLWHVGRPGFDVMRLPFDVAICLSGRSIATGQLSGCLVQHRPCLGTSPKLPPLLSGFPHLPCCLLQVLAWLGRAVCPWTVSFSSAIQTGAAR